MKIFLAITTARQIEGDMMWVRVEKAHVQASEIDKYVKDQKVNNYAEDFDTEFGPVKCQCIRGVMEVELEGDIQEALKRGENE